MTVRFDPWHTITVTAVTSVGGSEEHDDYDLVWDVEHPQPHENGCPNDCMTQQEIDEQTADGLPSEPGTYRIRAWGEYWPANQVCEADFDGGVEVEHLETARAR